MLRIQYAKVVVLVTFRLIALGALQQCPWYFSLVSDVDLGSFMLKCTVLANHFCFVWVNVVLYVGMVDGIVTVL